MRFADYLLPLGDWQTKSYARIGRFGFGLQTQEAVCGNTSLLVSLLDKADDLCHTATSGQWRCWCLGELITYSDANGSTGTLLQQVADDLSHGTFQPATLNGHFKLIACEASTCRWHLWTNRLGTFHSYYATDGRRTLIGSIYATIAKTLSRRNIDWEAVGIFLAYGYFPDDRTFFDDVFILRPASHYVFSEDGRLERHERYWDWNYQPDRQRSYDDTVNAFAGILHRVLEEHTRGGRVALPISGGLDSRSIIVPLSNGKPHSNGHSPIWSYSYGYTDDSIETRIASRIAATRHLDFERFTVRPYLFDKLDAIVDTTEGYGDVTQCRQVSIADTLSSHAEFVLGAHMGDLWLDEMGVHGEDGRAADDQAITAHLAKKSRRRGSDWLLANVVPTPERESIKEAFDRTAGTYLAGLSGVDDPDFRAKVFKIDQYVFRMTNAGLRSYQLGAFPRLPFYDTRFVDFFCTVPREYLPGRRLQIDYLKRFAPDLARITWQARNANLYQYQHFNTWLLPKRVATKAWRMMTGRKVLQRNWEVQFLSEEGQFRLERYLYAPDRKLFEIIAPQKVRAFTETFYRTPDAANGYGMSMLLTLGAWMDHFAS